MSSDVSAGWCPMPWQSGHWQAMLHRLQSGLMAHALLLKGVQGAGKYQFARALAARVLCEAQGAEFACEHCKSCELVRAGTHPDLLVVTPDAPGKPIKIDQVRRVNEFARKTAQQGGRRVIVMSPAEAMNVNAANALLKSLEEPGSDTLFLLVSARSGDMLPTIRSRCQMLTFPVPSRSESLNWLAEHIADEAVAAQLLDLAVGAPVTARTLFDNGAQERRGKLVNAVSDLFRGQMTPVEMALVLNKEWQAADLPELLGWLGGWLDDAVKIALSADESTVRNRDLSKMLQYLAGKASARELVRQRDWVVQQRQQLLEGANLNPQMLLEGVFSGYLELVL